MVVANVLVTNKANRVRFFEETFLMANVSLEVVFRMSFFILNIADIYFQGRKLWWKINTTKVDLPATRHVELMGKNKFAAIALDLEYKSYVVHVRSISSVASPKFSLYKLNVHLFCRP